MKEERLEPLDNLILSYSCPINWESMEGNERERFCKQCSKTVFNISDLSKKEADVPHFVVPRQADNSSTFTVFANSVGVS